MQGGEGDSLSKTNAGDDGYVKVGQGTFTASDTLDDDDLGVADKEDFVRAAVDEVSPVTQEEMQKRAERLAKLVSILAEETALKEAFA